MTIGAWLADRRDPWLLFLCLGAVLLLAVLLGSGALSGALSFDSAAYFTRWNPGHPWGAPRHPLYAWIASAFGASATAPGHVAILQGLLHIAAPFALYAGARYAGIGRLAAFALATVALFSQSGLYHLRLVVPESPAASVLLIAFGCTLAASRSTWAFRRLIVPIMLLVAIAYLLRPSHLPAVVTIPLLYALFAWRNRQERTLVHAGALLIALALPFLAQSAVRLKQVGDFNIVSFGGFQMSGLATFMLTPELIESLPADVQPTARAALAAREAGEADGAVARTPPNSAGVRSFTSAAIGYFDIYARSYDALLYSGILDLRGTDEDWVAFNRRLTNFSFATVMAAPGWWLAWIGGATARLAGHAIVTNVTMLVALALLAAAGVAAFLRRRSLAGVTDDLGAVVLLALGWLACTAPLTVLVTFPAVRYIDTAALLLPAIPFALALSLAMTLVRHDPAA